MPEEISFPRQFARTQRFTLGVPRAFAIAPDGARIAFLRTKTGADRATCLWTADPESGAERLIADPVDLLAGSPGEELTVEEKARRERSRQGAAGIVDFATDGAVHIAAFSLSGRLFVADLEAGTVRELPAEAPVIDPRPDPTGTHVAYLSGGALRVIGVDGTDDRALAAPDGPNVTYGAADFIAAEELDRHRGYWWSPDGSQLLAARVDDSPVTRWHIADLANPGQPAREVGYPAAGTANALVSLVRLGVNGSRSAVVWEGAEPTSTENAGSVFEYLVSVHWSAHGPALLVLLSRDQRTERIVAVQPDGTTNTLIEERDPVWIESGPGAPAWSPSGELAWIAPRGDAYRLLLGDRVLTPDDVQVRALLGFNARHAYLSVSFDDPTRIHIVRVALADGSLIRISSADGVNAAAISGSLAVVTSATLHEPNRRIAVLRIGDHGAGGSDNGGEQVAPKQLSELRSVAEQPRITARPQELVLGERELRGVLLLPSDHVPGTQLPVLLDPYGGPHGQMAVASHNAYLSSQWFADQGFAVLVVDGRGTPGRGPVWDRAVRDDFAGATLDDQVDALAALLKQFPDLDGDRVAIRGWSYGGYLSALAVLKRPDVFHAAVVGAPVTDWRLYDTGYTERYLGHPDQTPEVYNANSLFPDAGPGAWQWAEPHRPMMIIHGLADDNVVAAHTLRLSSALLAAGRPHEVLPLSGVTHMTPQDIVTENLMLLQVDFLRRALGD
ncbi:MAG TPA: prolyl oligopeptidase family serine peptidase [Actinocrinis sp.]|nr:prolyl oligopeptidase family serine peptidase [Actinocrinis sp.]